MMAYLTLLRSVGVRMLLLVALAACSTDKPQTKAPDVALRGLYDSETELVAIFEHVCIGTAPDFVEAPQRLGALGFHKLLGEDFFVSGDDNQFAKVRVVEILPYGPRRLCSVGHRHEVTSRLRTAYMEMLARHGMQFSPGITTHPDDDAQPQLEVRQIWVGFEDGYLMYALPGDRPHNGLMTIHFADD